MEEGVCCLLCILLWALAPEGKSAEPCAVFSFPTLNSSVLTAKINSTLSVPFEIKTTPGCHLNDIVTIRIRMLDPDWNEFGDFCGIRLFSGSCDIPQQANGCGCGNRRHTYQLKKTAEKVDNTQWLWTTDYGVVEDKELTFNILYPATVENLTLREGRSGKMSQMVEPGSSVKIDCNWQNGNPSTTARLLDRHGVEIENSSIGGQIQSGFAAVGCQDSGLIRCEAPGASHNETVMLLVRCPPKFETSNMTNMTFSVGQSLEMEFHVRTFTTNITDCQMIQKIGYELRILLLFSSKDTGSGMTGTPPDLTLTVRLNNVTEQEAGKWQLKVTNDAGTGHLDLLIVLQDDYEKTPREKKPNAPTDFGKFTISWITIASSVGAVVVTGTVCLCIVIACRRTGGKNTGQPIEVELDRLDDGEASIREENPPVAGPSGIEGRPMSVRSRGSDAYWEIDDVLPQAAAPGPPEEVPDDYLHAVPAASDIYERPAQPDYTHLNPLYEPLRHVYDNLVLRVRRILTN